MRAHILDANGVIINTVIVNSLSDLPDLVDASLGGSIGDKYERGSVIPAPEPEPIPPVVPVSVTRRQARQALLLRGLLPLVAEKLHAIEDPVQREMAKIEWEDSQEFVRARPLVIEIGRALDLDSMELDELFIFASTL